MGAKKKPPRPADYPEYVDAKLAEFREFLIRQPSFIDSLEWQVVLAATRGVADEAWLRRQLEGLGTDA